MLRKIFLILTVFAGGFLLSYILLKKYDLKSSANIPKIIKKEVNSNLIRLGIKNESIGFLPYWLLGSARNDYSDYINNLSVFSITVDSDGHIKKYDRPTEGEPGYFSLVNGKFDDSIREAKARKLITSLVVFSGDSDSIDTLMETPEKSAENLSSDLIPLVQKYGFDEINLDIEKVTDASPEARLNFKKFVTEVRNKTNDNSIGLTIDVTASSFIKDNSLVDPVSIADQVDRIIIMAYDFHFIGSSVTGPVAPERGAGDFSEYDVETAIREAVRNIDFRKIILGIPLYGYEWESISGLPRSATIPSTGLSVSNKKAEDFLEKCASCEAKFDPVDKEMNVIYKDSATGFYHQLFYPEIQSVRSKIELAKKFKLGGVAFWALGYEGNTILQPLSEYIGK